MPTIANNGNTYDQTPELRIRVGSVLTNDTIVRVKRNGIIIGIAVQVSPTLYSFTDSASIGIATYTAELIRNLEIVISPTYSITVQQFPTPVITAVIVPSP